MSEPLASPKRRETVEVVRGQLHKFMLIPIMPQHVAWIDAGPVSFGVEARALPDKEGGVGERGASLHVFDADRAEEYLRFDCFDGVPHYHYILNGPQHNVVWGYDADVNGPMKDWALDALRRRLPAMLRRAEANALADRIEREGFDIAALDKVDKAMDEAWVRTFPGTDLAEEGGRWYHRWKELHPQFNTVE